VDSASRLVSLFRTEKQKMLAGELYNANDAELEADREAAGAWRSVAARRLLLQTQIDTPLGAARSFYLV
jgi:hypothetical protein